MSYGNWIFKQALFPVKEFSDFINQNHDHKHHEDNQSNCPIHCHHLLSIKQKSRPWFGRVNKIADQDLDQLCGFMTPYVHL